MHVDPSGNQNALQRIDQIDVALGSVHWRYYCHVQVHCISIQPPTSNLLSVNEPVEQNRDLLH